MWWQCVPLLIWLGWRILRWRPDDPYAMVDPVYGSVSALLFAACCPSILAEACRPLTAVQRRYVLSRVAMLLERHGEFELARRIWRSLDGS